MTEKERIAWYEWRRNRDLVGVDSASNGDAATDPLVADPTLAKAVERLDAMLNDQP